jgi:2'-hydroxyisoflavone reductase
MSATRRELLKLAAILPMSAAVPAVAAPNKPLHILILGGTGFTGPKQVRYALERGHKITLFNRGRRPQDWPGDVEELTGDRETGDVKALRGRKFDVCIDNPTSVPHWVRDVGRVLKGNVKHYVFISTISVYADNSTPGADESAKLLEYSGKDVMKETRATLMKDMNLYGPLKAECEREAEKWFPNIATIIRPGLIVGPGDETDRFTYWPVRLKRGGEVLAPGDGTDPVQFIDARDLAEWTIRIVEQRALGAFNATGPQHELSMAALLYGIRAGLLTDAKLNFADAKFLEAQKVTPWGDMPVWVPGSGETAGFARVSIQRALDQGLSFRTLAQTAADALTWFESQPAERQATLRAGIKPERETEVLKALAQR